MTGYQIEAKPPRQGAGTERCNTIYMDKDAAQAFVDFLQETEANGIDWHIVSVDVQLREA